MNGEHQQIELQMELGIHAQDDSDMEGDDGSRFPNPIEEMGTRGSGHWIKTTIFMPYPIGI